jgi:TonB family protein
MSCGRRYAIRYKVRGFAAALCFLAWLLPAFGPQARSGEVGSIVKVSSKEADDNLQVKTLQPEYPPEAKAKGIEGIVRLRIVIDERGDVIEAKALSGDPLLVPSAISVVKRFPYRPFVRNGKRVVVTTEVDIPFDLHPTTLRDIYDNWMSHLNAATQLRQDGKIEAALGELQRALEVAKKLKDEDVAHTYSNIALIYSGEGRYRDAGTALEQQLRILQSSQTRDELEIANTQSDLAASYII